MILVLFIGVVLLLRVNLVIFFCSSSNANISKHLAYHLIIMIMSRRTRGPKGVRAGVVVIGASLILILGLLREHGPMARSARAVIAGASITVGSSSSTSTSSSTFSSSGSSHPSTSVVDTAATVVGMNLGDGIHDTAHGPPDSVSTDRSRKNGVETGHLDCAKPIRLGDEYGGWQLCRPMHGLSGQLVYTVGIGRNIKWDIEMIREYKTNHHGWDPTPTAIDFFSKTAIPQGFNFHKIGLGAEDGNLTLKLPHGNFDSYTVMSYWQKAKEGSVLTVPILTVKSMMQSLGHSRLAILKIDIEGAEFDVIRAWAEQEYEIPADQVLVEFHERYFSHEQGYKEKVKNAVDMMSALGFDLIIRTNLECTFANRTAIALRRDGVIKGK